MEKIVILSANTKHNELYMSLLSILFPECEIQIQSKGIEAVETVQKVNLLPRYFMTRDRL